MKRLFEISKYILALGFLIGLMWPAIGFAQKTKVLVLKIQAEIDPAMERYVKLGFEEANKINADYVLIDMNTYGGRVDNADAITQYILNYKKPVFVLVNPNAASAGAWISLACDKIYMTQNATIGAATVVNGEGQAAPDKYQSYMRGKMRATAAANGRDPQIAEAMVDPNIGIEGIIEKGKVLTFTTAEAIKHKYCEGEAKNLTEVLSKNDIQNADIQEFRLSPLEKIVALFLNPFLSGILLLIILGGIYFELQTPGVGFPLIASITAAVFYFIPYYLTGLAENWEIAIFIVGLILLMIELLIIPGFGLTGISGLAMMFGSLFLMMLNNKGFNFEFVGTREVVTSLTTITLSLIATTALIFVMVPKILNSRQFSRIALQTAFSKEEGYTASSIHNKMVGKMGVAQTVLRPSGKVLIDNVIYDASTTGDFVEQGTSIIVVSQEGTSLKVKKQG